MIDRPRLLADLPRSSSPVLETDLLDRCDRRKCPTWGGHFASRIRRGEGRRPDRADP